MSAAGAAESAEWIAGCAVTLRTLAAEFGHRDLAAMIASELCISLDDFERAGVEESDVDTFRPQLAAIEERERKRRG